MRGHSLFKSQWFAHWRKHSRPQLQTIEVIPASVVENHAKLFAISFIGWLVRRPEEFCDFGAARRPIPGSAVSVPRRVRPERPRSKT